MGNLPDKSICQTYTLRDQHSFDFLVCEGGRGWSATHSIGPFGLMMLLGNFLLSYFLTGVVEILETLSLTAFGSYIVFHTNDAELETKAGSLLGDWLFNDLLGVLLALYLLRALDAPGLLGSWVYSKTRPPILYCTKLVFVTAFVLLPNLLPSWIEPSDCDNQVAQDCINAGLMLSVALQTIIVIVLWAYAMRRPDDYKYLWLPRRVSDRKINYYFGFWLLFIIVVGLQNAQPYIPLYHNSFVSQWGQVWFAELIWAMIVFVVLYIGQLHLTHREAYELNTK